MWAKVWQQCKLGATRKEMPTIVIEVDYFLFPTKGKLLDLSDSLPNLNP
jgi:hypothetical protein